MESKSMAARILFCATYPTQPIGYGRVANKLSNFLSAKVGAEVHYFGFSNFQAAAVQRKVQPGIRFIDVLAEEGLPHDNFGTTIIAKYVRLVEPDYIFIYNDIIVVCRLLNALQEAKAARLWPTSCWTRC